MSFTSYQEQICRRPSQNGQFDPGMLIEVEVDAVLQ